MAIERILSCVNNFKENIYLSGILAGRKPVNKQLISPMKVHKWCPYECQQTAPDFQELNRYWKRITIACKSKV
jgi:hypothetical protein